MALSFMNKKNGFLHRIKNLFGSNPSLPSYREGIAVTVFFFSCLLLMSFIFVDSGPEPPEKLTTITAEMPDGRHLFARVDSAGTIDKLFVEGKKVSKRKTKDYQPLVDSLLAAEAWKNTKPEETAQKKATPSTSYTLRKAPGDNAYQRNTAKAQNSADEAVNFNLNINDSSSKVAIRADEQGFSLYVDDSTDTVVMDFSEKGGYMRVIENGKTVVDMNLNENGFNMNVDNEKE